MLASELYASVQSTVCIGPDECHWCSAKCKRLWPHDEQPTFQYNTRQASTFHALRPSNSYICTGCWHFRRKSVTIRFLDGKILDRKAPKDFSWFITEEEALAIDKKSPLDKIKLYELLLKPPTTFCLMIRETGDNRIQSAIVNDMEEIRADTPLRFTIDNVLHEYTIYELEKALKNTDVGGNEPGVQALFRIYGQIEHFIEKDTPEKKKRGGQFHKEEEHPQYPKRVISSRKEIKRAA